MKSLNDRNNLFTAFIFKACFTCKYTVKTKLFAHQNTTKNILGIAHPKHSILLLVSRILEGDSGYFALLVASNQIYSSQEKISSN